VPAYYNERDPFCCEWLRNLIREGHIPDGTVDERSIADVRPGDLAGFGQCHFFAGIGGWPLALRLAGVPDDYPIWTGSCPCQPFSAAGQRRGTADERHLWPVWERLVAELRPPVVVGEQVEQAIRHGWLDIVAEDLEAQGYAVGAAVLGAHSVRAPHKRSRLYWAGVLADADGGHARAEGVQRGGEHGQLAEDGGAGLGLGDPQGLGREGRVVRAPGGGPQDGAAGADAFWDACDWLPCLDGKTRPVEPGTFPLAHGVPARVGRLRAYGNAVVPQVAAEFIRAVLYDGGNTVA
jgi:DNA (cytosine-5)-methyltransferase 1